MRAIIASALAAVCGPALATLNIFACTPEWGALAQELGGDKASIYTATSALQDPHRIEARPSLIARARRSDLVVCTGAELEVGWLPQVLAQSGNEKIQAGRPGYFEAASAVELIERPSRVDRSLGDVHAAGNPHLHLDPRNISSVARALAARMGELDAQGAPQFAAHERAFQGRWREAMARWEREAGPLKDMPLVTYHKDLSYLFAWLGMRNAGTLEPKPGLPPSTAYLAELLAALRRAPAKAVVRSAYQDPRGAEWLAQQAGLPLVMLPYTVGGSARATDLFGLFDDTIARLLAVPR